MDNAVKLVFACINEVFEAMAGLSGLLPESDKGTYGNWVDNMRGDDDEILIDSQVLSFLIACAYDIQRHPNRETTSVDVFTQNDGTAYYYFNASTLTEQITPFAKLPKIKNIEAAVRSNICVADKSSLYKSAPYTFHQFQEELGVPAPRKLISVPKGVQMDDPGVSYQIYAQVVYAFWVMLQLYGNQAKRFLYALRNMLYCAVKTIYFWWRRCCRNADCWIAPIVAPAGDLGSFAKTASKEYVPQLVNCFGLIHHLLHENDISFGMYCGEYNRFKKIFVHFLDFTASNLSSFNSCSQNRTFRSNVNYMISGFKSSVKSSGNGATLTTYNVDFKHLGKLYVAILNLIERIQNGELNVYYKGIANSFLIRKTQRDYNADIRQYLRGNDSPPAHSIAELFTTIKNTHDELHNSLQVS